jgi:hypothetical protein
VTTTPADFALVVQVQHSDRGDAYQALAVALGDAPLAAGEAAHIHALGPCHYVAELGDAAARAAAEADGVASGLLPPPAPAPAAAPAATPRTARAAAAQARLATYQAIAQAVAQPRALPAALPTGGFTEGLPQAPAPVALPEQRPSSLFGPGTYRRG